MNKVVLVLVFSVGLLNYNQLLADDPGVQQPPLHDFGVKVRRAISDVKFRSCSVDEKFTISNEQFCNLADMVNKVLNLSRQIVSDNDDPAVIPRDRDRRLFREAMEKLNSLISDDGVLDWIKESKKQNANLPAVPNPEIWTDPFTQLKWMVLSNKSITQTSAALGCKTLGAGWRLPESTEIEGVRPRIVSSGLKNLDPKGAYWDDYVYKQQTLDKNTGAVLQELSLGHIVCLHNNYASNGIYIDKEDYTHCGEEGVNYYPKAFCVQGPKASK